MSVAVCYPCGIQYQLVWNSMEVREGCRELRWNCSVISTQLSQGVVSVLTVVRTWAGITCSPVPPVPAAA